ncbi:hypothetical protein BH23ACT5_BH23ACT5_00740 [soil metagenome]
MTAEIHRGEVAHSMDHLVLDLATPDGAIAYFTIYSLGLMRDVGAGRVALLRVSTPDTLHDWCFGETVDLAERMQARLRGIRSEGGSAPAIGTDHPPFQATISRLPTSGQDEQWLVESAEHTISASWSAAEPAFWLSAAAPAFHPTRDYVTTMISYRRAHLVVDGQPIAGEPYDHDVWGQRLGRTLSSCHVALAETAVESV